MTAHSTAASDTTQLPAVPPLRYVAQHIAVGVAVAGAVLGLIWWSASRVDGPTAVAMRWMGVLVSGAFVGVLALHALSAAAAWVKHRRKANTQQRA